VIEPAPVIRFVRVHPAQLAGLTSLILTVRVWYATFEAGMMLVAAKAVIELMMASAANPKIRMRSLKGVFIA
jgi:hypothetical protein